MPITHTDGQTYYSQAEVENAIKDRVKNQAAEAERAAAALKDAEKRLGEIETIRTQAQQTAAALEAAKAEAAQHANALARFRAAGSLGIADPETIDALEFAHTRAMAGVEEGKRVDFSGYLGQIKADPTLAPSYLRPVLAGLGQGAGQAAGQGAATGQQGAATGAQGNGAGAAQAGQNGAQAAGQGQQGTNGQGQQRPSWAPAVAGQQPVTPGGRQDFAARVQSAQTLDDIAKIQAERRAR